MVAVCPTCHTDIHHNKTLVITDAMLYEWKKFDRADLPTVRDLLYVEPANGTTMRVRAGLMDLMTDSDRLPIFRLANSELSFRIVDGDIMLFDCVVTDRTGEIVFRVLDNHIKVQKRDDVVYETRQGHKRVRVRATETFLPPWVFEEIRVIERDFIETFGIHPEPFVRDGYFTACELEVIEPGCVRVGGCWEGGKRGYYINSSFIAVMHEETNSQVFSAYGDTKDDPPRINMGTYGEVVTGFVLDRLLAFAKAMKQREIKDARKGDRVIGFIEGRPIGSE
jgi:hypothetical protein